MLSAVWSIARNAFTESIRQPVFVVLLLGTQILLALNLSLAAFSFWDDDKLLVDLGLSTMFLAGLFLAAFTATGVFSREIQNQTVLTVISKPVGRAAFVFGKYLGVSGALLVACLIWAAVFLLTVRHQVLIAAWQGYDQPVMVFGLLAFFGSLALALWGNYFYGWVFASSLTAAELPLSLLAYLLVLCFSKDWHLQSPATDLNGQLLIALLLVFEALAVLCAVALACSVRLGQTMTLALCVAIFFLGLSSDYLFGRHAQDHAAAALAYALFPNLQTFWLADALTQQHPVTAAYVFSATGYGALYVLAALGLAVALFQTREVG